MAGNTAVPGTTVASRLLAILGAFDAQHRSLTLTEIAARSGVARPSAHRLIAELVAWGALRRDATGRYLIGRRIWDLGLLAPVQTNLGEVASPFLHDLYAATRATVSLAVRDGTNVLYVDRLSGHASVPVISTIGSRLPLHSTGVGKVLLAHAPGDLQRQVLTTPLKRFTAYTITQPARLETQLERIRHDGFATTAEEMTLGACSVAVPIATEGRVVAALSVTVADLRRNRAALVTALRVTAQGIARSL